MNTQVAKRGTGLLIGGCVCLILGVAIMYWSLWFVLLYVPLFVAAFVLAIVAMTQDRVGPGLALLLSSLFVPFILFVMLGAIRTREFKNDVRGALGESNANSKLELESYGCARPPTGDLKFILVGEVKNVGTTELHGVTTIGTFYDDHKRVVGTGDALLNVIALMPGQTSAFKAYGPNDPAVTSCSVAFKDLNHADITLIKK